MKAPVLVIIVMFLIPFATEAQTEFVLDPSQSMIMTGKGPGQDGTINPYYGQDCYAIIKNIGQRSFSIRIQQDGAIRREVPIEINQVKKVKLLKGEELYLDPNPEGEARASVEYEKIAK